jgi:hypothetical protein
LWRQARAYAPKPAPAPAFRPDLGNVEITLPPDERSEAVQKLRELMNK